MPDRRRATVHEKQRRQQRHQSRDLLQRGHVHWLLPAAAFHHRRADGGWIDGKPAILCGCTSPAREESHRSCLPTPRPAARRPFFVEALSFILDIGGQS
jgi:hypothetical protein